VSERNTDQSRYEQEVDRSEAIPRTIVDVVFVADETRALRYVPRRVQWP